MKTPPTLRGQFDARRGALTARLATAPDLETASDALQAELRTLEATGLDALVPAQARVGQPMLRAIRLAAGGVAAAGRAEVGMPPRRRAAPGGRSPFEAPVLLLIQGLLYAVLIGGLLAVASGNVWAVGTLLLVIVLLVVQVVTLVRSRPGFVLGLIRSIPLLGRLSRLRLPVRPPEEQPRVVVRVDADILVAQIEEALTAGDRALTELMQAVKPPPPAPPPALPAPLLDFLHQLLGEAGRPEEPDDLTIRIKAVPGLLEALGISVAEHPRAGGTVLTPDQRRLFEYEAPLDPSRSDYETLLPALVQDGVVVRRGLVVRPGRGAGVRA